MVVDVQSNDNNNDNKYESYIHEYICHTVSSYLSIHIDLACPTLSALLGKCPLVTDAGRA